MTSARSNLILNHGFFGRNRHREKEYDNIFSTTYKSLSVLSNIVFFILFPPVIAISSLFSKGILVFLMNVFLSISYCAKFIQNIQEGEVSTLNLVSSLLFLGASLAMTFYLGPSLSFMDVVGIINLVATGINSFFLVRNIFLPPFDALIKSMFSYFGHEISLNFFNKAPFSLEQDRPVLDRLLRKFYKHDSFSDEFNEHEIAPFNHLLSTLSRYINKFNEPFLGNIINHDRIYQLENAVSQLILHGNTDNSIVFIKRKLDFKLTKINLLTQSKNELIRDREEGRPGGNYLFFEQRNNVSEDEPPDIYDTGLTLLTNEIERQIAKADMLKSCLPGGV